MSCGTEASRVIKVYYSSRTVHDLIFMGKKGKSDYSKDTGPMSQSLSKVGQRKDLRSEDVSNPSSARRESRRKGSEK